jgi:hypothetical protein
MSRQICHEHCPKGGGGLAALLVLLAVVIIAAAARPVEHAADAALQLAITIAAIAAIVIGAAVVLGLGAWTARAVLRARQSRAIGAAPGSSYRVTVAAPVQAVSAPRRSAAAPPAAIEAPWVRLADLRALAAEHGYYEIPASREAPED